jgi:hypothetical protein
MRLRFYGRAVIAARVQQSMQVIMARVLEHLQPGTVGGTTLGISCRNRLGRLLV